MKKQLEAELISLAHRVLKLTGKEDLKKMQEEIALLYQKISVLRFLETHESSSGLDAMAEDTSFFTTIDKTFNNTVSDTIEQGNKTYVDIDDNQQTALMEHNIEKIKDIVAQMPEEASNVDLLFDDSSLNPSSIEEDLTKTAPSYEQLPIFEPAEPAEGSSVEREEEWITVSGFKFKALERAEFIAHLFQNNTLDFERALSQLNTQESYEAAIDLLDTHIKPDYDNWLDKDTIELRFKNIIAQSFG